MHARGKKVSVDVAGWSALWNFTALGATSVDRVITMGTYTNSTGPYFSALGAALSTVPLSKLGVGFGCYLHLPHAPLKSRIDDMLVARVQEIDVWVTPIPDHWWTELARFARS